MGFEIEAASRRNISSLLPKWQHTSPWKQVSSLTIVTIVKHVNRTHVMRCKGLDSVLCRRQKRLFPPLIVITSLTISNFINDGNEVTQASVIFSRWLCKVFENLPYPDRYQTWTPQTHLNDAQTLKPVPHCCSRTQSFWFVTLKIRWVDHTQISQTHYIYMRIKHKYLVL